MAAVGTNDTLNVVLKSGGAIQVEMSHSLSS